MRKNARQKIIVILGPTASGKSDLAVKLARKLDGEIISADSRQVYKGMDIGTGKITKQEMRGVPHHLLDVADPRRRFTAERYQRLADKAIRDIAHRGKLPIICGGTGFYIDAVVNGPRFPAVKADGVLRAKLARKGIPALLAMLWKLDPVRAKMIEASNSERNNKRRIIRAIEVARAKPEIGDTRKEIRERRLKNKDKRLAYAPAFIGIAWPRAELRKRIHIRLIRRLKAGMIDEVKRLHARGLSWKRLEELGLEYRYVAYVLQGKMTREAMLAKLETEINRYAKRQMTWFKRNKDIKWLSPSSFSDLRFEISDLS